MWEALAEIAEERGRSVHDLLAEISRKYDEPNLSSAVRVYIVEFYRQRLRLQPSRRGNRWVNSSIGQRKRRR